MRIVTIAGFLVGSRSAIERIATTSLGHALPLGLLLVLTGSLARNYDGAYLPHEWMVLTHGVGASVVNALLVLGAVTVMVVARGGNGPRLRGVLCFLGLFWMTAPMAWLYGIPWERWVPAVDALKLNAITLALVATWRVLLISRVLSVLYGAAFVPVLLIVALVSDVVLFSAAMFAPTPPVDFMGGFRHSEQEQFVAGLNFAVLAWTVVLAPVLLVASLVGLRWLRGAWRVETDRATRPSTGAWVLSAAAVVLWAGAAAWVREEQAARYEVERLFETGRASEAIAEMSKRSRADFPPAWDPPPVDSSNGAQEQLVQAREALVRGEGAAWVRAVYLRKSWASFRQRYGQYAFDSGDLRHEYNARLPSERDKLLALVRLHHDEDASLTQDERKVLGSVIAEWEALRTGSEVPAPRGR